MSTYTNDSGARRARTFKYGANAIIGTILLAIILLGVNWFAGRMQARIDLTRNQLYTTSVATENLLKNLEDQVTVTVYATEKDTPPEWTEQRRQLRDLLQEYRRKSNGKLRYSFKDPSSDEKVGQEAQSAGIREQQMQQASMTEFSLKVGYLGFVVSYKGKTEAVAALSPSSSLEYQLTRAINKVAEVNIPTVGVVAPQGNPMMGQESPYQLVSQLLENEGFTVRNFSPDRLGETSGVQMLMVFDPQNLSEETLYHLDQYVMGGGKLLVAANGIQMSARGNQTRATPSAPNVNEILEYYGVRIDDNLLEDWKDGLPQTGFMMDGRMVRYVNPFLHRTTNLAKDSDITKNLPGLFFAFPSSVSQSTLGTSGTIEVLAKTSDRTRVQEQMFNLEATRLQAPKAGEEETNPQNLVVRVKGPLTSRYATNAPPQSLTNEDGTTTPLDGNKMRTTSAEGATVIVAGSAISFSDEATNQAPMNAIFVVNTAEALTRGGEILQLRGRDLQVPVLRSISEREALWTQIIVLGIVPALLVVLGLLKWVLNRRRKAKYREIYGTRRTQSAAA